MIRFGAAVCHDLARALRKEWLETNGLGGYASSTIAGANTRRYHGLLVAATEPPVGRMALLSKFEESLLRDGPLADLGCNLYPGAVYPEGYRHLAEFRLDPFPTFTYLADDVCLVKRVFMLHGHNATVVQYEVAEADDPVQLVLRPLVAARNHHHLQRWNEALRAEVDVRDGCMTCSPYGDVTTLCLTYDRGAFARNPDWYYDFEYPRELDRGLEHREDLFCPGYLRMTLRAGETATVIASHREPLELDGDDAAERERERRLRIRSSLGDPEGPKGTLCLAADAFVVRRSGEQRSIIAGYPWFADWGRDAMIALPGLLLCTGRFELAREVLGTYASHCRDGLIPNTFPEAGREPAYNTVDASLWFVHGVRAYADATGDLDFVRGELWRPLTEVIERYKRGTRYGIRMDDDGLVSAGDAETQLTWMDAKVGDRVITSRHGKCVEINALWYNALRHVEHFCARVGEDALGQEVAALAERVKASFEPTFWNEALGCLNDCVRDDEVDDSVRPNQIFAVSLPYSLLPADKERRVVETVRRILLTPMGLRTLSPSDPAYVGRYEGPQPQRDGAYHQGTVWAWLIGPFLTAWLKVNDYSEEAAAFAREALAPLLRHLHDAGLGSISEVFDGDEPHAPKGAIAQAWSVAEVLKALAEIEHPT
ncbi:MAG: amylo-alpha-1,6-glucosidase [Armatimonadota bacterium]